ncbi:unnamed protein product, partial [Discosporangium mesarthrocarpum]
ISKGKSSSGGRRGHWQGVVVDGEGGYGRGKRGSTGGRNGSSVRATYSASTMGAATTPEKGGGGSSGSGKKQKVPTALSLGIAPEVSSGPAAPTSMRSHKWKASSRTTAMSAPGQRWAAGATPPPPTPPAPGRQSSRKKKLTAVAQEAVDSGQMKLNYMSLQDMQLTEEE